MKEEINEKREIITESMVEKDVNKEKERGDQLGWRADWIK